MTREQARLSILVLTEDSAAGSCETIAALVKKMLLLMDSACRTHLIAFEPQDEQAQRAMRGNLWKSRNPFDRQKIVLLGRAIAAKLIEDPIGFVAFHVDGDRRWAERASSENVPKFAEFVSTYVQPGIDNALRRQRARDALTTSDQDIARAAAAAVARLLRLTPFRSIEAWLYQNTAEARRLCQVACGRHVAKIDGWAADRGALDELEDPKAELCLGSEHHLDLAQRAFPADEVFEANKSYAAAVIGLLDCADLCAALARTHA
ncbi:hypothetical protein WMF31_30010 [Sorangium sp. So ce1036]|uniref:hypothetical protein n=1 Tax=Sorangium sp. So ce1036 TaxID=3133328 RepID=UPI003EFD77F3